MRRRSETSKNGHHFRNASAVLPLQQYHDKNKQNYYLSSYNTGQEMGNLGQVPGTGSPSNLQYNKHGRSNSITFDGYPIGDKMQNYKAMPHYSGKSLTKNFK